MKRDCVFCSETVFCVKESLRSMTPSLAAMLPRYRTSPCNAVRFGDFYLEWSSLQSLFQDYGLKEHVSSPFAPGAPKIYDELQLSARNLKPSR